MSQSHTVVPAPPFAPAAIILVGLLWTVGCQSINHADRGALLGGLTGAGVGAAIGDAKGNTTAGAVVGTAVGTLTGAAVGSEMDALEARQAALTDERIGQARAATAARMDDAVTMTRAGLGDEVIIQHLRANGVARPPSASELIRLKNEGVSEQVIRAMQEFGAAQPIPPLAPPTHVYVQEPCYPCPPPAYRLWSHSHWHARRHRPGVSWGVSFRH